MATYNKLTRKQLKRLARRIREIREATLDMDATATVDGGNWTDAQRAEFDADLRDMAARHDALMVRYQELRQGAQA